MLLESRVHDGEVRDENNPLATCLGLPRRLLKCAQPDQQQEVPPMLVRHDIDRTCSHSWQQYLAPRLSVSAACGSTGRGVPLHSQLPDPTGQLVNTSAQDRSAIHLFALPALSASQAVCPVGSRQGLLCFSVGHTVTGILSGLQVDTFQIPC